MRFTCKDAMGYYSWLNNDKCSGFVNDITGPTVLIIPKSDEAKMEVMLGGGHTFNEKVNERLLKETNKPIGSAPVSSVRLITNHRNIMIGSRLIDKKWLRPLNKKYRRQKDVYSFLANGSPYGFLRIVSPCNDWWIIIAPLSDFDPHPNGFSQLGLDPFPMEVLM